ncbi:hypothetical protein [Gordonia sp. SID5947]|uniref:hypothetical protein n=1 Tax=Gordonia sp. SID5947 TaxID=2690315 RepID=UPI0019273C90|nr:hypothetical protein [Gordonia sp. SID5947]
MRWRQRVRVAPIVVLPALTALALVSAPSVAATATRPDTAISHDAQVAPPPPGAIVAAFADNQLKYCALICPHIVDFVVQVPIALVRSPGVYTQALAETQSADRATGIALASVTEPARTSMSGIIDNDLNLVLPRAQNALEVATVEMFHVADTVQSGAGPAAVGGAFDAGRAKILDALNAPIVPNPPQIAVPTTSAQESVLSAIDIGSAVLFQAPEILMTGATESADVAADDLAANGDVNRARAVGAKHLDGFITKAGNAIGRALR